MAGKLTVRRAGAPGLIALLAFMAAACDSPFAPNETLSFLSIAAGAEHSCVATEQGVAWCWGRGTEGQLGHLEMDDSSRPVLVAGSVRFSRLAGGRRHTCGISTEGEVHCWGWGHFGQLGNGTTATLAGPTRVSSTDRFVDVSAGGSHSCAVTDQGVVHCWGENSQGQLGDGTDISRLSPVAVADTTVRFVEVSAGAFHTCARSTDDRVFCWGLNHVGQLGTGSLVTLDTPAEVASTVRFRSISAGVSHTCGISTEGASFCWGSSEFGELGTGGYVERGFAGSDRPQATILGYSFSSVSVGEGFSCAIQPDGTTACWGRGVEGQFGNGQPIIISVPIPNIYGPRAVTISVGNTHGCLISTSGQVMCWGSGSRGQLGTSRASATTLPARVNIPRDS
jgi:alpha-tubulin suppressor-like RCC1 family protein